MADKVQNTTPEEQYQEIVRIYDHAEQLLTSVYESSEDLQEAHFELVNPLSLQMEEMADQLVDNFIDVMQNGKDPASLRKDVETSFRKYFSALQNMQKLLHAAVSDIANNVMPVLYSLKDHMEKVMVIFFDLMKIGLDRIMPQAELERFKKRQPEIALQLHQMSMQR